MDHRRRNDPEFDEFEKLLGEIPKVTSGNDYTSFPICFSSSRSSPDLHLPGEDSTLTSAFAEGNFNFGMPNQTLEYPQVMSILANHFPSSSPCVYFRNAQPQHTCHPHSLTIIKLWIITLILSIGGIIAKKGG